MQVFVSAVPTNMACNFEFSLCHWRPVSYNNGIWKTYCPHIDVSQRSLPNTDHTTNSKITDSPYEIVIEGTVGNNNNAYIAIDDTDIRDWSCDASQPVSCNFEEDFCNFRRESEYDHPWTIINTGDTGIGRPSFDHTKKGTLHNTYGKCYLNL
ncbi:unnamed protein product [Mytilus edulis]|uniref:MAM domain-containing protein n=1 Tax=Mytilus edulis TaxID=6550 RepID=A0A8S3RX35_MYTED|nr:unnamed protein product [Mytilus edulis]